MPNIITGHHGTHRSSAEQIVKEGFSPSSKPEDWLGDGAYFFQDAPTRATEWANTKYGENAAVIESEIDLADFIDLLDIEWVDWLIRVHDRFVSILKSRGELIPIQKGGAHRLDRGVLNYAVKLLDADGVLVRGIRGAFIEGEPIYPKSALYTRSHVQLAVRDLSAIKESRILSIETGMQI